MIGQRGVHIGNDIVEEGGETVWKPSQVPGSEALCHLRGKKIRLC